MLCLEKANYMQHYYSQGLFHGAIAQSGVALSPWALAKEPREIAFELGRELGIDTNNTAELLGKN